MAHAQVITVLKKKWPVTVYRTTAGTLDEESVSVGFKELNLPSDAEVYVRCDADGNPVRRGKERRLVTLDPSKCPVVNETND